MRNDIKFKPIKIPTLNELLGIEDDVEFRFVYFKDYTVNILGTVIRKDFEYSRIYRIKNNQLLCSEDIPFLPSNISINDLMSEDFIGIQKISH